MADRMKPMGMDRALTSKDTEKVVERQNSRRNLSTISLHRDSKRMGAKYDSASEAEVRIWIQELTGEDIGQGPALVEKNLKNGIILNKLLQKLYAGTPNLPPAAQNFKPSYSESELAFKQMENIEKFLKGSKCYGLKDNSLFQTVDLYEGRNMAMVLATILQVGTEAQRHRFNGPTCGAKPTEKHVVNFTPEQLRAGQGIIGLQAGTNKCASQKGMSLGAVRHIADIKADDMSQEGQGIVSLQAGTNQCASQKGMSFGATRHVADIRADEMSQEGHGVIGLQAGTNKCASQKGMSLGAVRHISDIRADDMSREGQGIVGLQAGTNQCASQKGMSFGSARHVSDIKVENSSMEGHGIIGLQAGSNKGASQTGMNIGGIRHVSDLRTDECSMEGHGVIGLQSGSNKGASQSGMVFGGVRHISDIRVDDYSQDGAGIIGLQYGTNKGASQAGSRGFGTTRHIADIQVRDMAEDMYY
ncbi:calponin-1-like isoform X1 [Argopecten irradians]|uniref:calponin-1-like isoform X1 n=2 Tax=Argopecten irradians TaxID=31199 RepID=UPI0037219CEE